jgi:cytochrome c oxidase cbb3-type subunit 3
MTSGWSLFITVVALANVAGAVWLLLANGRAAASDAAADKTTHVWDGDLTEFNNPLPRWWFWLFILSVIFGLAYLFFFPGLGSYQGSLGWSSKNQLAAEQEAARALQAPRYARFAGMSLPQLSQDPDAMGEARSLFATTCTGCHGSDARGAVGFPNLTDNDWLYGNAPDQLLATIGGGRVGVMPAWGAALGDAGVSEVVAYLQSLSSTPDEPGLVQAGATRYATFCVACHGADARGNQILGAPNLADTTWVFGGDSNALHQTIAEGRQNQMPAHNTILGEDRVRLMAAYVLSLGTPSSGGTNDGSAGGG